MLTWSGSITGLGDVSLSMLVFETKTELAQVAVMLVWQVLACYHVSYNQIKPYNVNVSYANVSRERWNLRRLKNKKNYVVTNTNDVSLTVETGG